MYQATLRHELHRLAGVEWEPVDPRTGMAEIAGVDPKNDHGVVAAVLAVAGVGGQQSDRRRHRYRPQKGLSQGQLAAAQKATRPAKPESLSWTELRAQWRG